MRGLCLNTEYLRLRRLLSINKYVTPIKYSKNLDNFDNFQIQLKVIQMFILEIGQIILSAYAFLNVHLNKKTIKLLTKQFEKFKACENV